MKLTPISRYRIYGHSMGQTLTEGQVVWVYNWAYLFAKPKIGDIIIFKFEGKAITKRVTALSNSGVRVKGDNQSDSLEFPEVDFKQIIGKVLL